MTLEEKAKAYDEALEKAKYYQKINNSAVISAIFPELMEIDDEDMVRYIGNAITYKESTKYLEEKGIDMIKAHMWLESIKHQPKHEWSKEDSIRLKRIIDLLRHNRKVGIDATIYQQEQDIDWLKSLMFYKQWKPSDKQINALSDVLSLRDIKTDILSELLKCLKKLK